MRYWNGASDYKLVRKGRGDLVYGQVSMIVIRIFSFWLTLMNDTYPSEL